MSMRERYPKQFEGRHYSRWHRRDLPAYCGMIDLDGVDYCRRCGSLLVLVEATQDIGVLKPTTVLRQLATQAGLPAWLLYYSLNDDDEIVGFRAQQVAPTVTECVPCSPRQLRARFIRLHAEHVCEHAAQRDSSRAAVAA